MEKNQLILINLETNENFIAAVLVPSNMEIEVAKTILTDSVENYLEANDGFFESEGYVDYISQWGFQIFPNVEEIIINPYNGPQVQ